MNKLVQIAAAASVVLTGFAATPAMADRYRPGDYYRGGYEQSYGNGYDRRGFDQRGYDRRYDDRGYDQRYDRRQFRNCRNSGTTGTILGAVVGGLLGREIGRGGYRNRPSGTGLILGAGAGALAGRAIERNGCR